MAEFKYLLLNSQGYAVGRAATKYIPEGTQWRMRIDDGDPEKLKQQKFLSLVGNSNAVPTMEARVISCDGKELVLEPMRPLDDRSVRKNLRVPIGFSSYIYPIGNQWKGRLPIVADNLSCGGIAFFCDHELADGEQVQVVIPVTAQPLLLTMKILRSKGEGSRRQYAAQFLDLLHEEESMIRESVFNLQLKKN